MPLSTDEIKNQYPLPVYNYRVDIGGESMGFSEVSGLSIGFETVTYKESPVDGSAPGPRVMHMPSQSSDTTLTLKKGIIRAASVPKLYGWISQTTINLIEKKDIIIQLCDEEGAAVVTWKVVNAFPTKLDAPTFDANSNEAAIESMELKADKVTVEEA